MGRRAIIGLPVASAARVSGDGAVEVNVLPYTDQSLLAACQARALRAVRYDLVARTITPVVG